MRIDVSGPGAPRVMRLVRLARDATVADLADAVGWPGARCLDIDGTRWPAAADLADTTLCDGAVVRCADLDAAAGVAPGGDIRPHSGVRPDAGVTPAHGVGPHSGVTPAAGLVPGVGETPGPAAAPGGGGWELQVIAALDAGGRHRLTVGSLIIGSGEQADIRLDDPTVSGRHAMVRCHSDGRIDWRDLGSASGTWLDGRRTDELVTLAEGAELRLGNVVVALRRSQPDPPAAALVRSGRLGPGGKIPFNRPPRARPAAGPPPLVYPVPPAVRGPRPNLAVVSILVPVAFAAVMVAVTGNYLFAAMTGLGPLMAIGGWWSARRAARRTGTRDRSRYGRELARFETELATRCLDETLRRRACRPDPAELASRARTGSASLWERRRHDDDAFELVVGRGEVAWQPRLAEGPQPPGDEVIALLARRGVLRSAPVSVSLRDRGVVGIVGPPEAARAVARGLLVQLALLHGPADAGVVVVAEPSRAGQWAWAGWLAHTDDGAGGQRILTDPDVAAAYLESLLAARDPAARRSATSSPGRGTGAAHGADPGDGGPVTVLVVDDEELTVAPRSPVRAVLRGEAGPAVGIVIAASVDRLPASCSTIVTLATGTGGLATVVDLRSGDRSTGVVPAGLTVTAAEHCARALARFEDTDAPGAQQVLPTVCTLSELAPAPPAPLPGEARIPLAGQPRAALRGDAPPPLAGAGTAELAAVVAATWAAHNGPADLRVPIGMAQHGPFLLDLVTDGPHALVAGTTGSGKSELLRSWVVSLASHISPDELNLVLIDYKGGSAFDQCAALPHTVGVVTDLDGSLGERALRCLDAEIDRRMSLLRVAGATDFVSYAAARPATSAPLPRLVVVIDEFATLAAELADFSDRLTGIAQRGRSLGVHLVLATQRPAGAVNDNIRANTNIRIALRVQDSADSNDVIGVPDAAHLSRAHRGRAYVRLGPGDLVAVQSAYSGGPSRSGVVRPVHAVPYVPGPPAGGSPRPAGLAGGPAEAAGPAVAPTELACLVDACRSAARSLGLAPARVPWPAPLPLRVELADLARDGSNEVRSAASASPWSSPPTTGRLGGDGAPASRGPGSGWLVPFALGDDPDHQASYPLGWDPAAGNLLIYGTTGSGSTTALVTIALSLVSRWSPDAVHLYGIDLGGGGLAPLDGLPHCGGIVAGGDDERARRLVRSLLAEVLRRRGGPTGEVGSQPRVVLLVDGLKSLLNELDAATGMELGDALVRVIVEGAEVGVSVVATADHPAAVRHAVAAAVNQKLVLRLAEPADARQFGLRGIPGSTPGRGQLVPCGLTVQVADPGDPRATVAALSASWLAAGTWRGPGRLGRLPTAVKVADVAGSAHAIDQVWTIPLGIAATDLAPCTVTWYPGDHVVVAGPPRSGRTSTLGALGAFVAAAVGGVALFGLTGPPGRPTTRLHLPAGQVFTRDQIGELWAALEGALRGRRATCLVVDDAESFEDPEGRLAGFADAGVRLIVGGRADALRSAYTHWTKLPRSSRLGLLLLPDVDLDGDLLGVRLPRRADVAMCPGRGYAVEAGRVTLVQAACQDRPPFS